MSDTIILDPKYRETIDNAAPEVAEICDPFLKKHGLNTFLYAQFYDDGSCYGLINNAAWDQYFWEKDYTPTPPYTEDQKEQQSFLCLWQESLYSQVVDDARNLFDFDNPVSVVVRQKGYCESFSFGTSQSNRTALSFYLNHQDKLEQFGQQFKEQGAHLIQRAQQYRARASKSRQTGIRGLSDNEVKMLGKITVQTPIEEITLTRRETDCVNWLLKGYSSKAIAQQLNLSSRTVETYLDKVKQKCGVTSKIELIKLLVQA